MTPVVNHKENFFIAFAYFPIEKTEERKCGVFCINLLKGSAYIPLIGAIGQIALGILFLIGKGDAKEKMCMGAALAARVGLSLAGGPFVLPWFDLIATIWGYKELQKW